MQIFVLCLYLIILLGVLSIFSYLMMGLVSDFQSWHAGAPFVGIPIEVAREALKLAKTSREDIFYDLGCGDGRVLRLAIEDFGAKKAVGYEIGWWPYLCSRFKVQGSRLKGKIEIHRQDLFQADLSRATVVFLYLYPKLLEKLKGKLKTELPENARVIVITWGFQHPFGKPELKKIIPWQPKPFEIFIFSKDQII